TVPGLALLRAQVFVDTAKARLDLLGASLVNDGLNNASFEGNLSSGWSVLAVLAPGQSYTFSIWAKAASPEPEHVCLVLWGVGKNTQSGQTCVVLGTT